MIDARGQSCPIPVVMVQNAVKKENHPSELQVKVDAKVCVENITRYAATVGYTVSVEEADGVISAEQGRADGLGEIHHVELSVAESQISAEIVELVGIVDAHRLRIVDGAAPAATALLHGDLAEHAVHFRDGVDGLHLVVGEGLRQVLLVIRQMALVVGVLLGEDGVEEVALDEVWRNGLLAKKSLSRHLV